MPTFSYKGYDFDVDHTPSAEEFTQMSAYVDSLPPKEQPQPKQSAFEKLGLQEDLAKAQEAAAGLGEAARGIAAGTAGFVAAIPPTALQTAAQLSRGEGVSPESVGGQYAANIERIAGLVPAPETEMGQELSGQIGEFINRYVNPVAPLLHVPGGILAAQPRAIPRVRGGDIPVPKAAESAPRQTPAQAAAAAMERETAAKATQRPEVAGQMEMFPETPLEGQATPYEAGQMGVAEPVAPKLQRRQMELPFGEERGPLIADIQGQIFRGDVTTPEARLALEGQAKAFRQEIEAGRMPDQLKRGEPLPALQDPVFLETLKKEYLDEPAKINEQVFETLEAQRAALKQQQIEEMLTLAQTPEQSIATAERQKQREIQEDALFRLEEDLRKIVPGIGVKGRIRKQAGGILFDFGKKPEIDKIAKGPLKKAFPELTRVAETPEEVASLAAASPDVERGVVGKTIAQFTKGMLFEKFKTDNPILKYTYDTVSEAVDAAALTVKNLIQKQLAPELRKLSKQEMGELGDVLVSAMKNKKELTPEFLREHGFSENQIRAADTLKKVHEDNLRNLNESRRLAGKPPVEAYKGYVAGLASGNFRKLIYTEGPDGELVPVGIVGSNFRHIMESRVNTLLEQHPEWKVGPEKYTGVTKRKQESTKALTDALTILSDNNPNFAEFAKAMDDIITSETYKSLGAKKHTMGKKGIMGMQGDKPWQNSYENAVDLFNAQIRYTETMAKWSEFSKAMDKLSVVFSNPEVQAKQPNALEMADSYVKNAMGQNPSKAGQAFDGWIGAVGEQMGVGPAVLRHTISAARNTVNSLFFTLNHAWMAVNLAQPTLVMPETKAFLRGRGIELNLDPTGISDLLTKGSYSSLKHIAGWKETPFEQAMWKYAKEHGIDQTNLIDSHNAIQAGPKYLISRGMKLGANAVEAGPRSVMFATMANLLEQAGYGKDPDIFPVARQLTDMAMTDYRHHEQIRATQHLGALGEMSTNLTSFKHNTLSRYALFAREMGKGNYGAFTTSLIAALTYAGIMGFPGFTETDAVVEQLSNLLGKPTSLTKLTLDMANDVNSKYHNKVGDVLAMGAGAHYGVDLHNRVGMPSIAPSLTGGAGKLVDIIQEASEFVSRPNEWNAKQLTRQLTPPPLQPWMDVNWFTRTTSLGEQIALNKQGKGAVMRTEKDVLFKKLGFTGSAEAKGRALDYAASQQDKYYEDARKKISVQLQEITAANNGSVPEAQLMALMKDYIDAEGSPESFLKSLETAGVNFSTTTRARRILSSQGASVSAAKRLERTPR